MGSIPLDNGESVYIHDGTGTADPVAISAAEGSSLANLMRNRERFDYTWADAAERGAQTGMVQGSRAYQEDTKTEYLYDNSQWRLATPYAEFIGADVVIPFGALVGHSSWSVDSSRSTDTTFVTVAANTFTFVRPGVYMISMTCGFSSATAADWFVNWATDVGLTQHLAINGFDSNWSTITFPYRISSDNTPLYVGVFVSGAAATMTNRRVRIVRLG